MTSVTLTSQQSGRIEPLVSKISMKPEGNSQKQGENSQIEIKTNNTTFIIIRGTGDREPEYCVEDYKYNNKYIFLKYDIGNKSGILGDFFNAKKNANALNKGRNALKSLEDTMAKKLRLFKIKETIKTQLKNIYDELVLLNKEIDSYIKTRKKEELEKRKIVVIGISHGSLLVHAALIKLAYQLSDEDKQKYAKHLHIWTIGSPQYIPKDLLVNLGFSAPPLIPPPDQQILNFYHVNDPYLPILSSIKWLMKTRIPDLKYLNTLLSITNNWEKTSESAAQKDPPPKEYFYYTHSGLVFVNATSCPKKIITKEYFVPYICPLSKILFHRTMFILYPVLPFKECYVLACAHEPHWKSSYFHSILRSCSPNPFQNFPITIKGGKKKKALKTNRIK